MDECQPRPVICTCIYGVPGTGKTFLAGQLAKRTGALNLEGDKLKPIAHQQQPDNIFTRLGTCEAYQAFGELNPDTAVRGLLAVRDALSAVVNQTIAAQSEAFILEGAFLDPHQLRHRGRIILVTTLDETTHRTHFYAHREKTLHLDEFRAARLVQNYLVQEAQELGIEILDPGSVA